MTKQGAAISRAFDVQKTVAFAQDVAGIALPDEEEQGRENVNGRVQPVKKDGKAKL